MLNFRNGCGHAISNLVVEEEAVMRSRSSLLRLLTIVFSLSLILITASGSPAIAQDNSSLVDDRAVNVERKKKRNRRPRRPRPQITRARPKVIEQVPLLRLDWQVLKHDNRMFSPTSPLAAFHSNDRLLLKLMVNQDGYLYVIHQKGPNEPGKIIFPDSRINNGRNEVANNQLFTLPSNCPAGTPGLDCAFIVDAKPGQEFFTIIFSRDLITDILPESALNASIAAGGIPANILRQIKAESEQSLQNVKGRLGEMSFGIVNTNRRDNEEIFQTLMLVKGN